jgi:hypothetical protein
VEIVVGVWMGCTFLWTSLWVEKIPGKTSGKGLRGVVGVT